MTLDIKGRNGYLAGSTVGIRHPADLPDGREQEAEREGCGCHWVTRRDFSGRPPEDVWETCPIHTPPEPDGA